MCYEMILGLLFLGFFTFTSFITCKNHHLGCNHIVSSLFQLFDPKLFLKADLRTKEDLRRDQVLGQSNC